MNIKSILYFYLILFIYLRDFCHTYMACNNLFFIINSIHKNKIININLIKNQLFNIIYNYKIIIVIVLSMEIDEIEYIFNFKIKIRLGCF